MVNFERLVSRNVARYLSDELDLSGIKMSVNKLIEMTVIGALVLFVAGSALAFLLFKYNIGISVLIGTGAGAGLVIAIYAYLEYVIDKRRAFVENILPDYIQLAAANLRSGISLDNAMVSAARPEFKFFSDDIKNMDKQIYSGETMQNALTMLGKRYRSRQLQHLMRMINESIRYGGSMNDLLKQMAKDLRNQAIIQKEISGQLFLYTIFITFAVLIGAPALYALTNKMIAVTDGVWGGILQSNPNGLPSTGVSFIRPTPPKVTVSQYYNFSIISVIMRASLGSLIVSVISNGSVLRGAKYLPIFLVVGIVVFYVVGVVISAMFASTGTGVGAG